MSKGGGKAPTSTSSYVTSVPQQLMPQFEALMGSAMGEYFNTTKDDKGNFQIQSLKPYVPYSTNPEDYIAGFSPLQQQVQYEAAGMERPGQFGAATNFATRAGLGGEQSAEQALGYGQAGYQSGMFGQQLGVQAAMEAAQRAQAAEQAAYDYGRSGYQSGMLGQQLGVAGGAQYGGIGAGYGAQAAGMAPQAQMYGAQAAGMAPQAQMYGQTAADIGQMGLLAQDYGRDVGEEARRYARQAAGMGDWYNTAVTTPSAVQAYMSPYEQAVIGQQKQNAILDYNIQMQDLKSQAARSGAYGGSRQAIQAAQAERALNQQLQGIEAAGRQSAYDRAIQSMQYGAQTGLAGLSGAQAGLGTALTGGQLGLAGIGQAMAGQQAGLAGLGQAGQLYGTGIQGAGMGLEGTRAQLAGTAQGMQGAQAGLAGVNQAIAAGQLGLQGADIGLKGTQQGMQGAQVGLQGVQGAQAGYDLMNRAGANLADIGTAQQASDISRMGFQNQIGTQEQAQQQALIDQAIKNYTTAQQYPFQQLSNLSSLLHGYYAPDQTVSTYENPNIISQMIGAGTSLANLGAAFGGKGGRAAGGRIKDDDGIDELMIRKTLKKGK